MELTDTQIQNLQDIVDQAYHNERRAYEQQMQIRIAEALVSNIARKQLDKYDVEKLLEAHHWETSKSFPKGSLMYEVIDRLGVDPFTKVRLALAYFAIDKKIQPSEELVAKYEPLKSGRNKTDRTWLKTEWLTLKFEDRCMTEEEEDYENS